MQAGEKIDGDVAVFGGSVSIPAEAEIDGDLVVFGGSVEVNGTVTGDIGAFGGSVNLGRTAVVGGNIGLVGGEASKAEGATIGGEVRNLNRFGLGRGGDFDLNVPTPPLPATPPMPGTSPVQPEAPARQGNEGREYNWEWPEHEWESPGYSWGGRVFGFFSHVVGNIAFLLAVLAVSWLVAAFMPEQMKVVGDTITTSGPVSFVVGLSTTAVVTIVGFLLALTICLAFVPLLAGLVLGIALLLGWISAGQLIGERLLAATGRPYSNFVASTLLGVAVLTVIAKMPIISQIPCLGFIVGLVGGLIGLIVGLTGLGAVILTRFGTQPYVPGSGSYRRTPPGPGPASPAASDDWAIHEASALERAEAELRAKIKEALSEAGIETGEPAPITPAPDEPKPEDSPAPDRPDEGDDQPKPAV
jgi:hypothetical protein